MIDEVEESVFDFFIMSSRFTCVNSFVLLLPV